MVWDGIMLYKCWRVGTFFSIDVVLYRCAAFGCVYLFLCIFFCVHILCFFFYTDGVERHIICTVR